MRQIVLDTETTGLDPAEGHRIIEIGCVEIVNRRSTDNTFHIYINPEREIDQGAIDIHGITNQFLADKPRFADVARDFLEFVKGAELIIHNAPFDVGFFDHEFKRLDAEGKPRTIADFCTVVDTLALARKLHPGQKNDLDSLCKRYSVDNTQRTLHGALLDAEILADVYLAMTGGQTGLFDEGSAHAKSEAARIEIRRVDAKRPSLRVLHPTAEELDAHAAWLEDIEKESGGACLWKALDAPSR
jgi:DNA polymerase III subunit epsilon